MGGGVAFSFSSHPKLLLLRVILPELPRNTVQWGKVQREKLLLVRS